MYWQKRRKESGHNSYILVQPQPPHTDCFPMVLCNQSHRKVEKKRGLTDAGLDV